MWQMLALVRKVGIHNDSCLPVVAPMCMFSIMGNPGIELSHQTDNGPIGVFSKVIIDSTGHEKIGHTDCAAPENFSRSQD